MTMLWHDRDSYYPAKWENSASFRQHNEDMKRFRLNHPAWAQARGGTEEKPDCFTLLPVRKVNFDRISSN